MAKGFSTDYATYREIMGELAKPIIGAGLDTDTIKRLYESKLVYLENLRVKCFYEINGKRAEGPFTAHDYQHILLAISESRRQLRELMLLAIEGHLTGLKAG